MKTNLDSNFIALGYAAFLSEEDFTALVGDMPIQISYVAARAALRRHLPQTMPASSADWPPPPDREAWVIANPGIWNN